MTSSRPLLITTASAVFFALMALAANQLLMTWAFRWVTNLQAGVISQLTVVLSILLGAVVLGDRLTPVQIVGSGLTLAGILGVVSLQAPPQDAQ